MTQRNRDQNGYDGQVWDYYNKKFGNQFGKGQGGFDAATKAQDEAVLKLLNSKKALPPKSISSTDPSRDTAEKALTPPDPGTPLQTNASIAPNYKPYYYSGVQAQIYFEDILIDEVIQFGFSTVTNRAPIYGYASKLFDTVADGNLIVQGSFTINFVEAGYVNIIAQSIRDKKLKAVQDGSAKQVSAAIQTIMKPSENVSAETSKFRQDQLLNQINGLGNKEFRRLAKTLAVNKFSENLELQSVARFDTAPVFDIFAIFGDYSDSNSDHTVRKISNVYLTGQSQTIITNGEPVAETYSFIGRDIT